MAQIFANQLCFRKLELKSAKLSRPYKTRLERPIPAIMASLSEHPHKYTHIPSPWLLETKKYSFLLGSISLFAGIQIHVLTAREESRCLVRYMKLLLRKGVAERGKTHKGPLNTLFGLNQGVG